MEEVEDLVRLPEDATWRSLCEVTTDILALTESRNILLPVCLSGWNSKTICQIAFERIVTFHRTGFLNLKPSFSCWGVVKHSFIHSFIKPSIPDIVSGISLGYFSMVQAVSSMWSVWCTFKGGIDPYQWPADRFLVIMCWMPAYPLLTLYSVMWN